MVVSISQKFLELNKALALAWLAHGLHCGNLECEGQAKRCVRERARVLYYGVWALA
jgi:hypothetical protein